MSRIKALAAQMGGALIALAALRWLHSGSLLQFALIQSCAAATLSYLWRQPGWWVMIHLLLAPAAAALLALQVPGWLYLAGAILMALVFWGTIKGDVPLFLSSNAVTEALERIILRENTQRLVDLGAGVGSVVVPLARYHPQRRFEGWERAPIPWAITALRGRKQANLEVIRKDFWQCDLSVYDLVYVFLSPAPMPRLGEKARHEMRPGSLLVSAEFALPGWVPEHTLQLEDRLRTRLYCYRIPNGPSSLFNV